ncbi:MAG: PilZ domain-containing protein [Pseudomonadota bacterium]
MAKDQKPEGGGGNWGHNRKHPRVKYQTTATIKTHLGKIMEGLVRDLSEGGVFIGVGTKIPVGSQLLIYIPVEIQKKKPLCIVTGRVVRIATLGETQGFAVRFDPTPSPTTLKNLRALVTLKTSGK